MEDNITKLSYEELVAQIEQILERFKRNEVSVDQLTQQVQRASELIKQCRERLTRAEHELTAIIEDKE